MKPTERVKRGTSMKKKEVASSIFALSRDSLWERNCSNLHTVMMTAGDSRGSHREIQQYRRAEDVKDCTGW